MFWTKTLLCRCFKIVLKKVLREQENAEKEAKIYDLQNARFFCRKTWIWHVKLLDNELKNMARTLNYNPRSMKHGVSKLGMQTE